MVDIIARAICDSIGKHSPRLLTIFTRSPKFIHQESLRHRKIYIHDNLGLDPDFSLSVSSARAIPFNKLLEEARDPTKYAHPVKWGTEQKGMSPGDELQGDPKELAQILWDRAANMAANAAESLNATGVHKSITNRLIEPFIHVNALFTATEPGWLNFFGLRLDAAADPTLRALAEACWKVWNESQPKKLNPGEWHLPYVDEQTKKEIEDDFISDYVRETEEPPNSAPIEAIGSDLYIKISVARCARLSYQSFETGKRSTIEEDLKLYQRLIGSLPIHASPAEHQATPDEPYMQPLQPDCVAFNFLTNSVEFKNPYFSGNLGSGWIQYRKTLKYEAIAPLPEAYR